MSVLAPEKPESAERADRRAIAAELAELQHRLSRISEELPETETLQNMGCRWRIDLSGALLEKLVEDLNEIEGATS